MTEQQGQTPAPSQGFSFVAAEEAVLKFWDDERIFERSLEQTRDGAPYIFYDGPPFATGLPHHGHLVASTIKDIVPRYWTMKGRYVMRRFGWDCHGLPIEHEIDKQFDANVQDVIAQLGIKGYNDACRGIVQRYTSQWQQTINRIGRWVDFENDYKTMDPEYMESVWWVVKQLWDKGLIYRDYKVVPFSTALGTVLANFEATQNYRDVQDPAVTVLFHVPEDDVYIAAWTTTPWTLPSNLALCVGADIDYVLVHDQQRDINLYVAEARLPDYLKQHDLELVSRCTGEALIGKRYEPLFPYFAEYAEQGAFVVVADDYVTTDSGTGIVHQAPAFGEDDYRVLKAAGIDALVCPVDDQGRFTEEVSDFAGQHVKEADKQIIRALKDSGALFEQGVIEHSYPFCYRSDTPLIYRAIPSWYVSVTKFGEGLLASNEQINWVPDHIKEGRFGNWLANAIDWSISRNRVWGTPLPIWVNEESGGTHCIGSIDELEALTGVRVDDLHREHVDDLTFSKPDEPGVYRRIEEVLDCWFESGSMPYAQLHYPFENKDVFEAGFPAEFIAEGLDQTRGWFYTLTVLATALHEKPAFKNVIVNGLVMAEDGKKMSKRLQNYTPPDDIMDEYGADALRLFLINSGVVRGEELRFSDAGVKDMVRRALMPWFNAHKFMQTYAQIDGWSPAAGLSSSDNILDRWIISRLQSLKADIALEMERYRLYAVVPKLFAFIEDLTNWYIRLNRSRFWGEGLNDDKSAAYSTLYLALDELGQAMAPFAPFLSEHIYQALSNLGGDTQRADSVHLCSYPEPDAAMISADLESAVTRMQQVILLGRQKREEVKINLRTPLASLTIIHRDEAVLSDLRQLEDYLQRELNVKSVSYDSDESRYIRLYCKPNFPVVGKRLGKRMKAFSAHLAELSADAINALQESGSLEFEDETFTLDDIQVFREPQPDTNTVSDRLISLDLDTELTPDLIREGQVREVVRSIQTARKDSGFQVEDRIAIRYQGDALLCEAVSAHADYVSRETLAVELQYDDAANDFTVNIDEVTLGFTISVQS